MSKEIALQNVNEFTAADIKKYICPTATDKEFFEFCQIVKARNLNPFLKEVHFVKYGTGPGQVIVGKDAVIKRAKKVDGYKGFKSGWFNDKGERLEFPIGKIAGAWCEVYAENKEPLFVPVLVSEYDPKNPKNQAWNTKGATMIRKVAIVQAHREFAPEETGGMYEESELEDQKKNENMQEITEVWSVNLASIVELPEHKEKIQMLLKKGNLKPDDLRTKDEGMAKHVFELLQDKNPEQKSDPYDQHFQDDSETQDEIQPDF